MNTMTFAASSDRIVFDLILERVRNDLTDLESRAKYLEGGNLSVANWRNYNLAKSEKALLATAAHVRRIQERLGVIELANSENNVVQLQAAE